jgi:molecular chaperone GrpE (heat shock protein)
MTEEHILKLSLLENGLDFIIRGIDELYELYDDIEYQQYISPISQPQKDYKYGVLHLFSGFLLLLKERLSRHMPELIFQGRMEDVKIKLSAGEELNTVNLDEALKRLKKIEPKVSFSESDTKVIRKIQKYRNRFEHYKFSANKFEVNKWIIDFIDLIDRFLINELKIDITSTPLNTNLEIRAKVLSIESVYKRMTDKRERELIALGEEKLKRFQSNRESILRELDKEAYIAYREEGGIDITMMCPLCCEDTLIIYGEFAGVCSNEECNSYLLLKKCDRCGQVTTGYEWEEKWCENCHDEIQRMVDRDD